MCEIHEKQHLSGSVWIGFSPNPSNETDRLNCTNAEEWLGNFPEYNTANLAFWVMVGGFSCSALLQLFLTFWTLDLRCGWYFILCFAVFLFRIPAFVAIYFLYNLQDEIVDTPPELIQSAENLELVGLIVVLVVETFNSPVELWEILQEKAKQRELLQTGKTSIRV